MVRSGYGSLLAHAQTASPALAALLVWHASNFAFNAASARLLGPGRYGTLAAVLSLVYLVSPLVSSIQTVTSRLVTFLRVGERLDEIRPRMRRAAVRLALAAALLSGAIVTFGDWLVRFLRLSSSGPVVVLALALPLFAVSALQRGVFQGLARFKALAIGTVAEAVTRLGGLLALLLLVSRSETAAALPVALAALAAVAVHARLLRRLPRESAAGQSGLPPFHSAATLATLVLLAMLFGGDVLAAKRYLDPASAGVYGAVSLSGKIVFLATSFVGVYAFPIFVERHELDADARPVLWTGIGVIAACSAALAGVYLLFPGLVVGVIFGESFERAGPHLALSALAFGLYALVHLTGMYLLSQRRLVGAGILAASVLGVLGGFFVAHAGITSLQVVMLVTFSAGLACMSAAALLPRWRVDRAHGRMLAPASPRV